MIDSEKLKGVAIDAARQAGSILMSYYSQALEVAFKGGRYDVGSLVTKADIESEQKISSILRGRFPDHGVFGEEMGGRNMDAEHVWYVDPLDGTGNFTRHIPLFGVSIGLVRDGISVLGVLYFPALDLLVYAEKGSGCFANDRPVQVSKRPLNQGLYYAGGVFKGRQQIQPQLAEQVGLIKIIDSSSYEFAQIAMGDAEIYYLANVPHDVVAGVCIVQEAGGTVTDGQGNPWRLDSKMILATNGVIHNEVLAIVKGS